MCDRSLRVRGGTRDSRAARTRLPGSWDCSQPRMQASTTFSRSCRAPRTGSSWWRPTCAVRARTTRPVAGCDVVIHTASPYVINVKDPQRDLVDPAVKGTLNVLRAAKAAGVRRVVLTSSMAAISDEPVEGKVFTEEDWNERSSLVRNPYYFSKTAAERAAWRFVEDETPGFGLVVINPYMILGPSLGPELNTSNAILRDILTGVYPGLMSLTWGFVDVRDAATAHVLAMENDRATGRYICAGESLSMKEIVALLRDAGYGDGYKLPRLDLTGAIWQLPASGSCPTRSRRVLGRSCERTSARSCATTTARSSATWKSGSDRCGTACLPRSTTSHDGVTFAAIPAGPVPVGRIRVRRPTRGRPIPVDDPTRPCHR